MGRRGRGLPPSLRALRQVPIRLAVALEQGLLVASHVPRQAAEARDLGVLDGEGEFEGSVTRVKCAVLRGLPLSEAIEAS